MTEVAGLAWIFAGLVALLGASGLGTCCLRLRSPAEFVLATYVVAWSLAVGSVLVLSVGDLVTRSWLLGALGFCLSIAALVWDRCGRPRPPELRPSVAVLLGGLRQPLVLVLAGAVAGGFLYTAGLALFTPVNEGDALSYHLPRAALWRQEHGLGYVEGAVDLRLNGNPPNAEIGQLVTMVLAGSERYAALPQLAAYGILVLSVALLARRLGLAHAEAVFGALLFATLPVVVLQAAGALNDLVVVSFLAGATVFALAHGRRLTVLFALALGLALGTKVTAVFALPTLALVLLATRRPFRWRPLAAGAVLASAIGSTWYLVNLAETGELDGGLVEDSGQRAEPSPAFISTTVLRLVLDVVDRSGAPWPYAAAYLAAALVVAALVALPHMRVGRRSLAVVAVALVAAPLLAAPLVGVAQDAIVRWWAAVGKPATPPFEVAWDLNETADPALSWYGPLGTLLLTGAAVVAPVLLRRGVLTGRAVMFALAPWTLLLTLAALITWDPFRGRFLLFGVLLAAATWGLLLRSPPLALSAAALGLVTLVLVLANYQGKPSGIGELLDTSDPFGVQVSSIWTTPRTRAQALLRPHTEDFALLQFVEQTVPDDAHVSVAPRPNDYLSPYFGRRLSREVTLLADRSAVPAESGWLVLAPEKRVVRCAGAWRVVFETPKGWRVERRVGADDCP